MDSVLWTTFAQAKELSLSSERIFAQASGIFAQAKFVSPG